VPPLSRLAARRDHLVVCGDDALAARVIQELTTTYGEEVTVLLRSREQGQGPRIARLPRVRIIERAELDADAFTAAQVQSARSLALLRQDDLGNFHAALRAQEINPDLRLVVAIFNTSQGRPAASPGTAPADANDFEFGKTWASPTDVGGATLRAGLPVVPQSHQRRRRKVSLAAERSTIRLQTTRGLGSTLASTLPPCRSARDLADAPSTGGNT